MGCGISARCFGYFVGFSLLITAAAIIHTWHSFKTDQKVYKIASLSVACLGVLTICIGVSCYCSNKRKLTRTIPVISEPKPFPLQSEDIPVYIPPSRSSDIIVQENPYSVPSSSISEVSCSTPAPSVGPVYMTPASSNAVYSIPSTVYATPSPPNVVQTNNYSTPTCGNSYMDPTNHTIEDCLNQSDNSMSNNGYLVAQDACNGYLVAQDSTDDHLIGRDDCFTQPGLYCIPSKSTVDHSEGNSSGNYYMNQKTLENTDFDHKYTCNPEANLYSRPIKSKPEPPQEDHSFVSSETGYMSPKKTKCTVDGPTEDDSVLVTVNGYMSPKSVCASKTN